MFGSVMNEPYVIPPETYATVLRLVSDIVSAAETDDEVLRTRAYDRLLDCCETETAAGRGSGFIWEALADVTDEDEQRLEYYRKGLALGRANREPVQTILLEMGRIHVKRGDHRQALPFLEEARSIAIAESDDGTEGAASALLLQLPDLD
ncbi:hypothetical protein [Luteolibacter luteus]|uniref:Tetratricopeptide repeat protein n=1 Tax=Luteolibacter luteus TaxID=2728835 RepID=A0A858RP63_9BACT|nr:hypothetical protein [Luteolibacter luteus]QJE98304.1 hypothetical protein HHL09_21815 [Luteolibacter luteus]